MAGRQVKVVNEQADRYGLPIGGATVDLQAFVRAVHDFLAAHARKLATTDEDDTFAYWKKEGVKAKAERDRLAYEREKGLLIDRSEHERIVDALCAAFRNALGRLANSMGLAVAGKPVQQTRKLLQEWSERMMDESFGRPGQG